VKNVRGYLTVIFSCLVSLQALAQIPSPPQMQFDKIPADAAIDRALKESSLTYKGEPFHAVLDIGKASEDYSGRIELWWVSATKYRLSIVSPKFSQTKIMNGDRVQEKDEGDYYPRWLETFVLGLMEPLPMVDNFRGHGGAVAIGPQLTRSCIRRDDRPGGITDQMTWGDVCFSGAEPHLLSVLTMNYDVTFGDWEKFQKKKIARTYETDVLSYQEVNGHITKLEELKNPDETLFAVSDVTPPEQRISTTFVSTLKEESLVEIAPDIAWPPVREGKTEGYMIVYARTDRTGQVRETAKHNSDQPGLEDFGMEQALRYKFKPLVANGVPQQMEMPLVLHFVSKMGEPIPVLSPAEMTKQVISCKPAGLPPNILPKGTVVIYRVAVDETGKVTGIGFAGEKCPAGCGLLMAPIASIESCTFTPYLVNGKPTYYKGDIEVVAP
jgi:hypothetical protein